MAALRALEKCGQTAEDHAKALAPVRTGVLRNSVSHLLDPDEPAAYVGASEEYATYVEMGTGIYVAGGRTDPWPFQDAEGNWHTTRGMPPRPFIKPSVAEHLDEYRKIITDEFNKLT